MGLGLGLGLGMVLGLGIRLALGQNLRDIQRKKNRHGERDHPYVYV